MPGHGLRGSGYFKFWVVARDTTGTLSDSDNSKEITIIEGPITEVNGDSGSSGTGQALIKWKPQADATSYTLRWKQLGNDAMVSGKPHTHHDWVLNDHSLPIAYDREMTVSGSSTSTVISPLSLNTPYAVHLSYERDSGSGKGQVFSARDYFVYPTRGPAGSGIRAASIPLRQRLPGTEYSYLVCTTSAPAPFDRWERFINHAFQQWTEATNGLVTVVQAAGTCPNYSGFVREVVDDVKAHIASEMSIGVMLTDAQITAYAKNVLASFDKKRIKSLEGDDQRYREVEIVDDTESATLPDLVFDEIAKTVGPGYCFPACAISGPAAMPANSDETATDIVISLKYVNKYIPLAIITSDFPGHDEVFGGDDVQYNSCEGTNRVYSTLVHEAGHALGIGGGNTGNNPVERGHPNEVIRDITMSYEAKHDCSPQPLDVMAIYAIYQTRDTR